jgi:drug/metabolite transporter (DMT)-like permease
MHLDNHTKLVIGIVFIVLGIGILIVERSSRGFGQRRQAGAVLVLGGLFLAAVGYGLINI